METTREMNMVADEYGLDGQLNQLQEEMSELSQAICKFRRTEGLGQPVSKDLTRKDVVNNLLEEIADVQIVLDEVKYLTGGGKEIDRAIERKVKRTIRRMRDNWIRWNGFGVLIEVLRYGIVFWICMILQK